MFFFFKQKTAYDMRISDWSSDVCSSDLWSAGDVPPRCRLVGAGLGGQAQVALGDEGALNFVAPPSNAIARGSEHVLGPGEGPRAVVDHEVGSRHPRDEVRDLREQRGQLQLATQAAQPGGEGRSRRTGGGDPTQPTSTH